MDSEKVFFNNDRSPLRLLFCPSFVTNRCLVFRFIAGNFPRTNISVQNNIINPSIASQL